ncbi:MAG: hypothetical protein ACE5IL_00500 [Myxococcota bacterium]
MDIYQPRSALQDPVALALQDLEPELERFLVGDALVERHGRHYRILSGDESWEELEQLYRHQRRAPSAARS